MGNRYLVTVLGSMLLGAALVSCGGGETASTPTATGASDGEYLAHLCTGLTNYRVALNSRPDAAGIASVVKEYIADMKQVKPPADLANWHDSYLKYLQDVVNEPTKGITQNPPSPPENIRRRLADQVPSIQECKYQTFLGETRPGQ